MSNFNFGSFSNATAVSSAKRQLKPYDIYQVKFNGAELKTLEKKDDPNTKFETIQLHFEGEDGIFEPNIFYPSREQDAERPTYKNANGHDYQRPSVLENTMYTLLQLLTVLDAEGAEKFKANVGKAKSFADVAKMFATLADKKKGTDMYIKLDGRNSNGVVYAQLPNAVGLNRNGELFPVNIFSLTNTLALSAYELQKQASYRNAKPTVMVSKNDPLAIETVEETDIDFDNLLG